MSLFKKNKNRNKVQNPYYSLGLLQQTMMINRADHHDLSGVRQAQSPFTGRCKRRYVFSLLIYFIFTTLTLNQNGTVISIFFINSLSKIVGQQKNWTSAACGGVRVHPSHPPSLPA